MIVNFDQSFGKSVDRLNDKRTKEKVFLLIEKLENAKKLSEIPSVKAMKGHTGFYRIRICDYRVGFELINESELLLILILHRKEIYKRFP